MTAFQRAETFAIHDEIGRRKYVSATERGRFLAEADRLAPEWRALCYVLTYTGCRLSEALGMTAALIDAERLTLTFRTLKRRRLTFRTVHVPRSLIEQLRALAPAAGGRLWPMHRATAWRAVKAIMLRAGISDGPHASPKGLRHGFGIWAADRNVPINLLQRWMGHASPATTATYVDAVGAEERQFATRMW